MVKLDFQLPEFRRVVWTSAHAREVWEPRIQRVSAVWNEIERLAVLSHFKPAALQVLTPDELIEVSAWCAYHNLSCLPLSRQGAVTGYANATAGVVEGKPWAYRVVIARTELASLFVQLWKEQDDDRIGACLGFPECCRRFFSYYWVKEGWRDLTFPMVKGEVDARELRVGGPLECNILLRWLGIRLVSHLPCSFYCEPTAEIGQTLGLLGVRNGYVQEMDWLTQMLSWPVRWTSLHGIGIVTTPVLKIVTDSTPLSHKVMIDRDGPVYPDEGARGTEFPFKQLHTLIVRRANDYADNGFRSREAMEKAHRVVMMAVEKALLGPVGGGKQYVLDLGCGNGKLLEEIITRAPWLIPSGVEVDEGRFQKAARRLLAHDPILHNCSIYDEHFWNPPYRLALVSVNRFREVDIETAQSLMARLRDTCHSVILYSYDTDTWPGAPGIAEFFRLEEQFSGDNCCALLVSPKRDNEHDPL